MTQSNPIHELIRKEFKATGHQIIKWVEDRETHVIIYSGSVIPPIPNSSLESYLIVVLHVNDLKTLIDTCDPFAWWVVTATHGVIQDSSISGTIDKLFTGVDVTGRVAKLVDTAQRAFQFHLDAFNSSGVVHRKRKHLRLAARFKGFTYHLKYQQFTLETFQEHVDYVYSNKELESFMKDSLTEDEFESADISQLEEHSSVDKPAPMVSTILSDVEKSNLEQKIVRRCKAAVNEQYKAGRLLRLVKNPFDDNEWLGVYAAYHEYYRIPSRYTKVITETFMGVNIKLFELNEWMNHIYRFNLDAVIIASSTITVFNDMPNLQNSNVFDHIFNNSGYLNMFTSAMYNTAISIYQKLPVRDLKMANVTKRKLILRYVALGLLAKAKVDAGETSPSILTSTAEAWRWLLVVDDINDIPWENGQGKGQYLVEIKGILDILERGYPYYVDKHADFTTYPRPLQAFVDKLFSQLK